MALDRILFAALGGAVGGGLGALAAKLVVPKTATASRRATLALVPVLIGSILGSQFAAMRGGAPASRLERAMARYTDGMMDSPRVRERFRGVGVDGARALGQELSHAGLKRLGAADLDEWNRVRLVMARHSPSVCAGLWSGQLDPLALVAELDKLSDADLDGWARVSGGAMRAELAATAPVTVDPGALAQTLLAAEGRVAEAERERFQHDLEQGNKLADDEACWAIETLMKTVAGMEPGPREAALRSLASL